MPYFFIFLLMLIGLVFVARPLTVLLHELGHAIPALMFTGQEVTIYIGSYGDRDKSRRLRLGKLIFYFRYNPLAWRMGLCAPSARQISINRQIFYTLSGPFASLLIGGLATYFVFTYDLHGFLKLFLIVFLGSAALDLIVNLVPSPDPIRLDDGTLIYNDGYSLIQLFQFKKFPDAYAQSHRLFSENRFAESADLAEKLLNQVKHEDFFRLAIAGRLQEKNYEGAKRLSDAFAADNEMSVDDLCQRSVVYGELELVPQALEMLDECLLRNPDHVYSLNNKGYYLTVLNRFEEALPYLDRAVDLDPKIAYAWNNRALARIKTGDRQGAIEDLNQSENLDPSNAYLYRNRGILYLETGAFAEALNVLYKARDLDPQMRLNEDLIEQAREALEAQQTIGGKAIEKLDPNR